MALSPRDFNLYVDEVLNLYSSFQNDVIIQIAKRLNSDIDIEKDGVFKWQVEKLSEVRALHESTVDRLHELTGLSREKLRGVLEEVGAGTIRGIDGELNELGFDIFPVNPSVTDSIIRAFGNQTWLDINNFVNQTLISTNYKINSIARMYETIVNETTMKAATGIRTFRQALAETVIRWNKKGLSSSFVDRGGHTWSIERYARTVLNSTLGNIFDELRTVRMREFGVDLVLMSSKPEARPMCALCQGTVMTLNSLGHDGYRSIYEFGYGTPAGVRGINCMHILWPYVEGVSTNNQRQYDSAEAVQRFGIIQKQRAMETRIRDTKQSRNIADVLNNEKLKQRYSAQLRKQQAQLREYVSENKLIRDYSREWVHTGKK